MKMHIINSSDTEYEMLHLKVRNADFYELDFHEPIFSMKSM